MGKGIEIAFREDLWSELGLKEEVETHESTHFVAGPRVNKEQTGPIPIADLFFPFLFVLISWNFVV